MYNVRKRRIAITGNIFIKSWLYPAIHSSTATNNHIPDPETAPIFIVKQVFAFVSGVCAKLNA